jgi:hypothetical protein
MKEHSVGFREEYSMSAVGKKALRRLSDRRCFLHPSMTCVQTQPTGCDADRLLMSCLRHPITFSPPVQTFAPARSLRLAQFI